MVATTQEDTKGPIPKAPQPFVRFSKSLDVISNFHQEELICLGDFRLPLGAPKLLMLGIAEAVAADVTTRESTGKYEAPMVLDIVHCADYGLMVFLCAGIDKCYVVEGDKGKPHVVQTDGISFQSAFAFDDLVDVDQLTSNDVHSMLRTYGVEAARHTIVNECRNVFGAYGISINPRHLVLISDHMTNLV